jgi:hypothetical protein
MLITAVSSLARTRLNAGNNGQDYRGPMHPATDATLERRRIPEVVIEQPLLLDQERPWLDRPHINR